MGSGWLATNTREECSYHSAIIIKIGVDNMPYIYKISNDINDKLYIGKTLYTIERRWYQHKNNAKNRQDLKHLPLYSAMNKYGIEHFFIEEIEEVSDEKQLSSREQYWIKFYNTYNYGYNASIGGDGLQLYDYDFIWELWQQGKTIKEISTIISCNDYVVRTVLDIHKISTEERKERSYKQQLNSHKPFQRAVYKINPNTDEILEEFESVSIAAKAIGGNDSALSKACNNNKIYYNFKWKYKEQDYIKKDFSPKSVCQLDLNTGEILQIFPSISAAARAVNGDSSYLSKVCRGIQKSSKGFGWSFLNTTL
jgi:hypothetical protein